VYASRSGHGRHPARPAGPGWLHTTSARVAPPAGEGFAGGLSRRVHRYERRRWPWCAARGEITLTPRAGRSVAFGGSGALQPAQVSAGSLPVRSPEGGITLGRTFAGDPVREAYRPAIDWASGE